MIVLQRNKLVCLVAVVILTQHGSNCELYKDLLQRELTLNDQVNSVNSGAVSYPDYGLDLMRSVADKRNSISNKFKNYMLNKDYANQAPEAIGGPVIRSYIPRTSAKRVPGAILNYALSPNEPKNGFYNGYYRSQALHRPAALK